MRATIPAVRIETEFAMTKLCHRHCIACRPREEAGFGLRFDPQPDGSVEAAFDCDARYQGYASQVHGGVIALLHDAAMTHCLFARRILAVTAKLSIRFERPVAIGTPARIRAWVADDSPPAYRLESEIIQGGVVKSSAEAMFYEQDDLSH